MAIEKRDLADGLGLEINAKGVVLGVARPAVKGVLWPGDRVIYWASNPGEELHRFTGSEALREAAKEAAAGGPLRLVVARDTTTFMSRLALDKADTVELAPLGEDGPETSMNADELFSQGGGLIGASDVISEDGLKLGVVNPHGAIEPDLRSKKPPQGSRLPHLARLLQKGYFTR